MAFKKWIHKNGLCGAIAKNAVEQYNKWKNRDPSMAESEIAYNMFFLRYTNPNSVFSSSEKAKISKYLSLEFYPASILEFSLISLDIEGNLNISDGKTYTELANWVEEFLTDFGYPKRTKSEIDQMIDNLDNCSYEISGNSAQTDHCFSRQIDHQKLTHNLML
jgi:hypothetical protein